MKLSSPTRTRRSGFTLVELLVVISIISIILTTLCGIYMAMINEWQRQQGEGDALAATSRACSVMYTELSQAVSVNKDWRGGTHWGFFYTLPPDSDKVDDYYVPQWHDGKLEYRTGPSRIFYLSDSTGHYDHLGNILWRGVTTGSWPFYHVVPDPTWDADLQRGRISPIDSIAFYVDDATHRVDITVTSSYRTGGSIRQMTLVRSVVLRNAN